MEITFAFQNGSSDRLTHWQLKYMGKLLRLHQMISCWDSQWSFLSFICHFPPLINYWVNDPLCSWPKAENWDHMEIFFFFFFNDISVPPGVLLTRHITCHRGSVCRTNVRRKAEQHAPALEKQWNKLVLHSCTNERIRAFFGGGLFCFQDECKIIGQPPVINKRLEHSFMTKVILPQHAKWQTSATRITMTSNGCIL